MPSPYEITPEEMSGGAAGIQHYYSRLPGSAPGSAVTGAPRPGIDTPAPAPTAPAPAPAAPPIPSPEKAASPENLYPTLDPQAEADRARAAALANAQATIQNINKTYDQLLSSELAQQAPINANNLGRTNALSALMGLSGSSSADTRTASTEAANVAINQGITSKVQAQRMEALNKIYGSIDDLSSKVYTSQLETNRENQAKRLQAQAAQGDSTLQALAAQLSQAGKTFDDFKNASPTELETLKKATGKNEFQLRNDWQKALPEQFKTIYTDWQLSKDPATGLGVMTRYAYDPLTKKNTPETYSTGLPFESTATGKLTEMKNGDQVMMYPNGTYKLVKAYTPTELERSQAAKNWADAAKTQQNPAGTKSLTTTQYSRLQDMGVKPALADQITSDILGGATLEDIRSAMRQNGVDTKVLDSFDQVVGIADLLAKQKKGMTGSSSLSSWQAVLGGTTQ